MLLGEIKFVFSTMIDIAKVLKNFAVESLNILLVILYPHAIFFILFFTSFESFAFNETGGGVLGQRPSPISILLVQIIYEGEVLRRYFFCGIVTILLVLSKISLNKLKNSNNFQVYQLKPFQELVHFDSEYSCTVYTKDIL